MAITVIARPKPEDYHKVVCRGCQCTLQFLVSDITLQHAPRNETLAYLTCPECSNQTYVSETLVSRRAYSGPV